jgi:STE24 endopeptidase
LGRVAHRLARPTTLALIVGAALWLWAAHALWSSAVPTSLHLPHLEASRFFGASFLRRSASYERFLAVEGLLAALTLLAVLAVYARRGHLLMRESAAGRIGTGMLLGMLGFAVVWLAEVPFGLAAVWWQRRYHVSHQSYVGWLVESFLSLGGEFVFVSLALAVAMGIAGVLRNWWWAAAAPAFVGLAFLFTLISPYLVPSTTPLRDPRLLADARALERSEGVGSTRVRVQDVHRFTTAPNAESAGFGPTRTLILWDTLLGGRFTRAQIRVVIGHELGHLAHDDQLRQVGWLALFLIPASALIAWLTRRRGGLARPEAVPLALFILVSLQLLATPLFAMVSRREEAAADWSALVATRDPTADRTLLRRLATTSVSAPDPPGWSYVLYADHPTIMQRIAMAYAWEEWSRPASDRDARTSMRSANWPSPSPREAVGSTEEWRRSFSQRQRRYRACAGWPPLARWLSASWPAS